MCQWGTASTSEFYGALAQCQTLVLAGNQIGDAGITAFADACGRGAMAKLAYLGLHKNQISDKNQMASSFAALGVRLRRG